MTATAVTIEQALDLAAIFFTASHLGMYVVGIWAWNLVVQGFANMAVRRLAEHDQEWGRVHAQIRDGGDFHPASLWIATKLAARRRAGK